MVVELRTLGTSLEVGVIVLALVVLAAGLGLLVVAKWILAGLALIVAACFVKALPELWRKG